MAINDNEFKHSLRFQPWVHNERENIAFLRLKPWAMFDYE